MQKNNEPTAHRGGPARVVCFCPYELRDRNTGRDDQDHHEHTDTRPRYSFRHMRVHFVHSVCKSFAHPF